MLTIFPYEINLYDLALCIYNNDTPIGGANDATRATNKLYALQKSCDCPINHRHVEAKG